MQLFASATPGGGNLRTISKTRDECPICLLSAIRAKTFRMCAPSISSESSNAAHSTTRCNLFHEICIAGQPPVLFFTVTRVPLFVFYGDGKSLKDSPACFVLKYTHTLL